MSHRGIFENFLHIFTRVPPPARAPRVFLGAADAAAAEAARVVTSLTNASCAVISRSPTRNRTHIPPARLPRSIPEPSPLRVSSLPSPPTPFSVPFPAGICRRRGDVLPPCPTSKPQLPRPLPPLRGGVTCTNVIITDGSEFRVPGSGFGVWGFQCRGSGFGVLIED